MQRREINLRHGWRLKLFDESSAWLKGFDDSSWREISVPHDFAVEAPFSKDRSSGSGYLPGGVAFYRKSFLLPEEARGSRIILVFDGAYKRSKVWFNSYYMGFHAYGYTGFSYDLTGLACFGDELNVVAVRVDHRDEADSRWFAGSGVNRKAIVAIKGQVSLDEHGVIISTKGRIVRVQANLSNHLAVCVDASIKHAVLSLDGHEAASIESVIALAEGSSSSLMEIEAAEASLWSPETPTLYKLVTEVSSKDGILDHVETIFGFRDACFDKDKGFFLNGRSIKIKGVCVHHDAGVLGSAAFKEVWRRRLLKLKEMGANAIRCSHNPHMPELYDLCDEIGFLVMDEAFDEWEGVKNKWVKGHNVYPPSHDGYYEDFPQNYDKDIASMVMRDRNHPSVILWCIGNEIDYPNDPYCHPSFLEIKGNNDKNKPANELAYDPQKPNAKRLPVLAKMLKEAVRRHDATRPVTSALAFPELSNTTGFAQVLDVVGYNYKEQLYIEDHKKHPQFIILGSENGKDLPQWQAALENDFISGQFLWTGIDFLGETAGWPCHGSESGLLDTAGFEKPDYYFRQSLWSHNPALKLFACLDGCDSPLRSKGLATSWNFPQGEIVRVVAFTNTLDAVLELNGDPVSASPVRDELNQFLVWRIPFEPGVLKVRSESCGIEDRLKTSAGAVKLSINIIKGSVKADEFDICQAEIIAVDNEGFRDSSCEFLVRADATGAGVLLGIDNGDLWDATEFSSNAKRLNCGRMIAYVASSGKKGPIELAVSSPRLGVAKVLLESV
ncbi:MAG: glycoside hydrolase family 2 [Clostridiales bacterium]|nr:glycoside hydrolase family 2 [Clostridiales bacterium]